ncbi:MAG: hypothetical protein OQJ74_06270, partial [Ignavibacteriaceae bacterium]|nr:hypothetical protein [Ignavibacteriaceae bacterium]
NIIRNNNVQCPHSFGGGLYFIIRDTVNSGTVDNDPGPYVYNNIISGNHSDYLGGGVSVWRADFYPGIPTTPLQSAVIMFLNPPLSTTLLSTIQHRTVQDSL